MLSFILVQPKPDVTVATLVARLRQLDGLAAFSSDELSAQTIGWYIKNTGIAISFGTVVLSASWWAWPSRGRPSTSSSMKNVRFMAALKAMGAPTRTLAQMVLLQAFTVGLVGYGLGVGLTAIFSNAVLKGGEPPFFLPGRCSLSRARWSSSSAAFRPQSAC